MVLYSIINTDEDGILADKKTLFKTVWFCFQTKVRKMLKGSD